MSSSEDSRCSREGDVDEANKPQIIKRRKIYRKKKDSKMEDDNVLGSEDNINGSVNVSQILNPDKSLLIYSNKCYMGKDTYCTRSKVFYTVNGSIVVNRGEPLKLQDDEFTEYEVHKVMKGEDYDSSTDGDSEDLEIEDVLVPTGHIINSNVYLPNDHWNTVCVFGNTYGCAVCGTLYDATELSDHLNSTAHIAILDANKPRKKFGCSIIRKVRNAHHCGVCNILIQVENIFDHNVDPTHIKSLADALGMTKNLKPVIEYQYAEPNNGMMEKFKLPHKYDDQTSNGEKSDPNNVSTKKESLVQSQNDPHLNKISVTAKDSIKNVLCQANTGNVAKSQKPTESDQPIVKKAKRIDASATIKKFKDELQELKTVTHIVNEEFKTENVNEHTQILDNIIETRELEKNKDSDFSEIEEELIPEFNLDEVVYLKLKSTYFEVTNTAYNSLVHTANGLRFCFVCSITLDYGALQKHVDSTEHTNNLSKCKFLSNNLFSGQLFRQMYVTYHCAICNVLMARTDVKTHLDWSIHIERYDNSSQKLNKKLKDILKSGAKVYSAETQKEFIYLNISEPTINVITYVKSNVDDETYVGNNIIKKCRMIILDGIVMKVPFESWNGISSKNGCNSCILCHCEFDDHDMTYHLQTESHNIALGNCFEKKFYPALIRKTNGCSLNCVICNIELPSEDKLVYEHLKGRRHIKKYDSIVKSSSTESYADCYEDPLIL